MPLVFIWGNGSSPVMTALGRRARVTDRDAEARLVAAENDFEVTTGAEHGVTPRWAHAVEVDDLVAFIESVRGDAAIVEWYPEDEDLLSGL